MTVAQAIAIIEASKEAKSALEHFMYQIDRANMPYGEILEMISTVELIEGAYEDLKVSTK